MKALLLAAGLGSRLRPLTDSLPKCLLPINNKRLLDIWLDAFNKAGIQEVLLNTHHLHESISDHVKKRSGSPIVRIAYEPELLGSAGTLLTNANWWKHETSVLVCNADNLTDLELRHFIRFHQDGNIPTTIASMATFRASDPSQCGIVQIDTNNYVTEIIEKPAQPRSDLANAGIYIFHPDVMQEIDSSIPSDIGYDLLPKLLGRMRAMPIPGYFRDIGTLDAYQQAQIEWKKKCCCS